MSKEDAELINTLQTFKVDLANWQAAKNPVEKLAARSRINEALHSVVEIVKNAGCHDIVVVQEPAVIGGRMAKVDPFANLFNDPYHNNVRPNVFDAVDQTIGIIKAGKYKEVKESLHRPEPRNGPVSSKKVFLVHGHEHNLVTEVASKLTKMGLEPVILKDEPNKGRTVIEKFEQHSEVAFAVVMMTDDDVGKAKNEENYKPRARQNVLFELGYYCARLGRDKVAALVMPDIEIPSDFAGVLFLPINEVWPYALAKELRAAGLSADSNQL